LAVSQAPGEKKRTRKQMRTRERLYRTVKIYKTLVLTPSLFVLLCGLTFALHCAKVQSSYQTGDNRMKSASFFASYYYFFTGSRR
jgi:hypothetical protein